MPLLLLTCAWSPLAMVNGVENGVRFFQQPTCHHRPEVYPGIDEERAAEMLRTFFQRKR